MRTITGALVCLMAVGVTLASSGVCANARDTQPDEIESIGKPFQVSGSVKDFCAMKPVAAMCQSFEPQLAAFLAESRDARWAAPIERLIAKSMLEHGKPWMKIRALECRRTRCALEYAVNVKDLDHDADGNEDLDRLMEPITGVSAPEPTSADGGGLIVSVLIWRKHS